MLELVVIAHEDDNVATTVKKLKKDEIVEFDILGKERSVNLNKDIPFGHKFAIENIKKGEEVFKYGEAIGLATEDINVGDYVHVHNLVSERGRGDLEGDL